MMPTKNIQRRLVLYVCLALLGFSIVSGALTYRLAYKRELASAIALEQQLVRTVQAQAEVAAYAANTEIAQGVIEGLLANPRIQAVSLEADGNPPFRISNGLRPDVREQPTLYPLLSPVDQKESIGRLTLFRKDELIQSEAARRAIEQTILLLAQIITTALLILLFSRYLIGRPVARLAHDLAGIRPGSGARVPIQPNHAHDEIGSLANSANILIDAAEKALAEVEALATTDPLTGLPNRRAFMARLENELERVRRHELPPTSVLMLDLDHFKQINDHHGHGAGDAVLRGFGAALAGELRKVDACGRLGGEEFAVILPGADVDAAGTFAERLRIKTAGMGLTHNGIPLRITVSIGIAEILSDTPHVDQALANADAALYEAKKAGRDRVVAYRPAGGGAYA